MNLLQYRHIIWDWNGTLLDDAWPCVDIMNNMLRRRCMPSLTHEKYRAVFGFPVKDYYQRLGFDFSKEPFDIPAEEFVVEYDRRRFECSLQAQARNVLARWKVVSMGQYLFSVYPQVALEEVVRHFGLEEWFLLISRLDNHYACSKVDLGKQLLANLSLDPPDVVLIGDTLHDFEVANALGVDCILVSSGHHSRKTLETSGALVVESLAALAVLVVQQA